MLSLKSLGEIGLAFKALNILYHAHKPGLQALEGIDKRLQNLISNNIIDMEVFQENFIIMEAL